MKIIQSYAHYDNGGYQYTNKKLTGNDKYLLFYTFLLSYLTLKKYYDSVTMYCNKMAYDIFIKYIPYDEIIIRENKYTDEYCYAYKLDIIEEQTKSFIHVDPDVFIFDDLFKEYINNQDKYDLFVQFKDTGVNNFCINKDEINICNDLIGVEHFRYKDNKLYINNFSTGVVGMNIKIKDIYIEDTKKMYNLLINNMIKKGENMTSAVKGWILEEVTLYFTTIRNNFNYLLLFGELDNAINDDLFITIGDIEKRNIYKYIHLWWIRKFKSKNINIIKNIIKTDFENKYHLIENYEKIIYDIDILAFDDDDESVIKFKI